jgi:Protein of unknown function (DUF3224)
MSTTPHAAGLFDVKMTPQPASSPTPGAALGRMLLDKRYHGDLDATAQGQMLSAGTATTGSAGYVAIEHVVGRLHGKSGSFVLQHHGLMNRGAPQLSIVVVPDSGTGELLGLAGTMGIRIAEGKHYYSFDYTLP